MTDSALLDDLRRQLETAAQEIDKRSKDSPIRAVNAVAAFGLSACQAGWAALARADAAEAREAALAEALRKTETTVDAGVATDNRSTVLPSLSSVSRPPVRPGQRQVR